MLRTAWRNLWRNTRRTSITLIAIALNTIVLVLMVGLVEGMLREMVRSTTQTMMGEVQVHAPEFVDSNDPFAPLSVADREAITAAAEGVGAKTAGRLYGFAFVARFADSGRVVTSNGARVIGVEPAAEQAAFDLPNKIAEGRYLGDAPIGLEGVRSIGVPSELPEAVVGGKLARTLKISVGDRIGVNGQAADQSPYDVPFRVVGILSYLGAGVDRSITIHADVLRTFYYPANAASAYMQPDFDAVPEDDIGSPPPEVAGEPEDPTPAEGGPDMTGMGIFEEFGGEGEPPGADEDAEEAATDYSDWRPAPFVHEVAISSAGEVDPATIAAAVREVVPGESVRTWQEINPTIADMMAASSISLGFLYFIFFLVAGLSVLNTMLMATFERMREFGVLKAIGTSPLRLIAGVAVEAGMLAAIGSIIGAILGTILIFVLQDTGIDLSGSLEDGTTIAGIAYEAVYRPVFEFRMVLTAVAGMFGIAILSALYPAWIAGRVDPVKSLHDQ